MLQECVPQCEAFNLKPGCKGPASPSLSNATSHVQVLGKMFFSLHRAEIGLAGEKEDELFLPQNVRIPATGAPPSVKQQCAAETLQRGKLSLVANLFGMDVQVCTSLRLGLLFLSPSSTQLISPQASWSMSSALLQNLSLQAGSQL